ncbi:putative glycosyltransferase [Tenacibaculum xiamenense]
MKKRYSKYIRALFLVLDLLVLNVISFSLNDNEYVKLYFIVYICAFWVVSSLFTRFYKIYRYTSIYKIIGLLLTQLLVFSIGFFAYFSIFREGIVVNNQAKYLVLISSLIVFFKFFGVYLLRKYRTFGKNYRKVIVLGDDNSTRKIVDLFNNEKELGYIYCGFFSDKESVPSANLLGQIENSFDYILKKGIDEIYCSLSELEETTIKKVTKFASKNNRIVKLIPNANELSNKNTVSEYYGDSMRVLKVKKMPFELIESKIVKRVFDIVFSIFVCVFILSWLYPLLFLLIKIESRGPAIFKQTREGLHGGEFVCYKFRSMYVNGSSDERQTKENDNRVTYVGAILRRTSLDEFPQFLNVLFGSMSVVGPRPHMNTQSDKFTVEVTNYIKRKEVKPGITGLAQVSGYRGEVKEKRDIENRVRMDIFYIENWSLALDLKIIVKTVFNIFKGEEKAY